MAYRIIQKENVFIDRGKTLATLFTFQQGRYPRIRLRYEVRAGKKGTGRILAKASCRWGYHPQKAAQDKIKKKVGELEFMDEHNIEKFERAGYIPNPYER